MKTQRMRTCITITIGAIGLSASASVAATPELVRDLRSEPIPQNSWPNHFVEVNGAVLFRASRYDLGSEVWRYDLDSGATTLLRDFNPGPADSLQFDGPTVQPVVAGGYAYFFADDGSRRVQLWRSDGTSAGTQTVIDIEPGMQDSWSLHLRTNGTHVFWRDAFRLWRTDGTTSQQIAMPPNLFIGPSISLFLSGERAYLWIPTLTFGVELWTVGPGESAATLVRDIYPGGGNATTGSPVSMTMADMGEFVLFFADNGTLGLELWRTDGTAQGTSLVRDIAPGPGSSISPFGNPAPYLPVRDGYAYFVAADSGSNYEVWRSDGSAQGTQLVSDVYLGAASSQPNYFAVLPDVVLFRAFTPSNGPELYRTDGTPAGTSILREFVSGAGGISLSQPPATLNGRAYFNAPTTSQGEELWVTDGTSEGTLLAADVVPGFNSSRPRGFAATPSAGLFFTAMSPDVGAEPYRLLPGSTVAELVANAAPDVGGSVPTSVTADGSRIYFAARGDGQVGDFLWRTDGDAISTHVVPFGIGTAARNPRSLKSYDGSLYFAANGNDSAGVELWRTNLSTVATTRVTNLWPGVGGSEPDGLTTSPFGLIFSAAESSSTRRPYRFNPTLQTPLIRLANVIQTGVSDVNQIQEFYFDNASGKVFFSAAIGSSSNEELWVSDGGLDSALEISINSSATLGSDPRGFVAFHGKVYFRATRSPEGAELWASDGTLQGTSLFANINPVAFADSNPGEFHVFQDKLLFAASGAGGRELYAVQALPDGGASGPTMVRDIAPMSSNSDPTELTSADGIPGAVFAATTPAEGRELWITDGTNEGTQLLVDIFPGSYSSAPANFAAASGYVYFTAMSPDYGVELWRTDGTPEGTILYADIEPGPTSSLPADFEFAPGRLYFSAETPSLGRELWSIAIPTGLTGDMNCDGFVTVADIGGFVLSLTDPAAYAAQFETCDIRQADINDDGFVTVADIGSFVALLTQ